MEAVKNNMELWNLVSMTDPKSVKKVSSGGRTFDSIDAQYQIQEATRQFGSYGETWGLIDTDVTTLTVGDTTLLVMKAKFFYPNGIFEINNAAKMAYVTNGGKGYLKVDEDAWKKLDTNTLTKALSKIGFNADVFMNKFADQEYLSEAFAQNELINPTNQQEIRRFAGYHQVDLGVINKHFMIRTTNDLQAVQFNEAMALIESLSSRNKK